jgi:beta-galactosidase/beta-glucuronidase
LVDYQVQADATGCIAIHAWTKTVNTKVIARIYQDEHQLTPDGGGTDRWKKGPCVWEATSTTSAREGSSSHGVFGAVLSGLVAQPKLWNAEEPHLYTLTMTVQSEMGIIAQVESCRIGFRTVNIIDGMVHVNGVPITVCGINRHEHDPDHGKVVSLDLMKKDICLMKYVHCFYMIFFGKNRLSNQ